MQTLSPTPASADVCTANLLPPGATLFPATPAYSHHRHFNSGNYSVVKSSDSLGNEIALQTPHIPNGMHERHGVWYGNEFRVDCNGIKWSRFLPLFVVDNFGDLVPVPA